MKEFISITAEFGLKDHVTFYALNHNNQIVGTLIIDDENISYYDRVSGETVKYGSDTDEFEKYVNDHNLHFHKARDSQYEKYNPNPQGNTTTDCTIRAYCKAENMEWDDAYDLAVKYGKEAALMPNDNTVVNDILVKEFGYECEKLDKAHRVTVNEFALANPIGTFILWMRGHVVTVIDGKYYDSWDSGQKKISKVYKKSMV